MKKLKSTSNEELLQAMAVIIVELTKRGMRVRLSYKNRETSYAVRLETLPFSTKIKTKK